MTELELPTEFVVFDMEWTAWEGSLERQWNRPHEYREIYDIGAVLVTGNSFNIGDTYCQLVTLELVPRLPQFSTELTGITQASIDQHGIPFKRMVQEFKAFAGNRTIYSWGTDGECLAENCQLKKVSNPFLAKQFRNMREVFQQHGIPAEDYYSSTIVEYFGKKNKHTAHRGLDDVLNIVEALRLLRKAIL